MPEKSIYDLELHEHTTAGILTITRVPGGWLYSTNMMKTQTFVPYNAEFNDTLPKPPKNVKKNIFRDVIV